MWTQADVLSLTASPSALLFPSPALHNILVQLLIPNKHGEHRETSRSLFLLAYAHILLFFFPHPEAQVRVAVFLQSLSPSPP